jgi:transmembrane sensor
MSDPLNLMRRIERAGSAIAPDLSDRDVERLVQGAARRRRRRARVRAGFATTAAAAAALAIVHFLPAHRSPPARPAPAPVATGNGGALRLADGSVATPTEPGSTLAVLGESAQRVDLALRRGGARFDVVPSTKRAFSVQAGDVTVTVLGTVFTVERVADRIGVTVERGTVRVDWKVGTRQLHRGESGWFPPLLVDSGGAPAQPEPPPRAVVLSRRETETVRANARPKVAEATAGAETAERLLAEADAERLAGHAAQGAAILRRLLRDHARDARAPLAAFTLGRLLLMELDRPREAAVAFAQVRVLAPGGSFAEDALAREVEAWRRAGDGDKVRARAQEYLKLYPRGRRVDTVRRLGELD